MEVYFADNDSYPFWAVRKYNLNILVSYAYQKACLKWFASGRKIMLDSGAFTASTKGITIDIDTYVNFYKIHERSIITVVNLDVIPTEFSEAEIELSAEKGWENFQYIKSKGVPVIHVFHQGENRKWLTKLMDNSEYFGVSPNDKFSGKEKHKWLTEVFSYICDSSGIALRKTHGFGVAGKSFLNFPFYSVDSSKPIQMAGRKMLLAKINNEFKVVELGKKQYKDTHFDSLLPADQKIVEESLMPLGLSVSMLRQDAHLLRVVNAVNLRDMYSNEKKFKLQQHFF